MLKKIIILSVFLFILNIFAFSQEAQTDEAVFSLEINNSPVRNFLKIDPTAKSQETDTGNFKPVYINYYVKIPVIKNYGFVDKRRRFAMSSRSGYQKQNLVYSSKYVKMDIAPIILKYSAKHNIDPYLIKAVIWAESSFNAYAVSPSGAIGLMQLMPFTAKAMGAYSPFDPEQNISAGAKYLKYLLNKFKATELALAAYNAGPYNVQRYGGIPPFSETRRYVSKTMKYYNSQREN
jgi:hypothetical protein